MFVFGLASQTYLGLLNSFIDPANIFPFLILGVGYLLAAIEYDRPSVFEGMTEAYRNFGWKPDNINYSSDNQVRRGLPFKGSK